MCESLSNSNYHLCEELGRGRFGVITRCFSAATNSFFAAKSIDKTLLTDQTDRLCLENEPKIMNILSPHPNIVQIHDVFDSSDALTIIMDLCQPYTLYDVVLKSNGGLSEAEAAEIMKQLLSALAHCHKYGVVHRDLKPENVLFDEQDRVKLADFGNAEWVAAANGVVGTPYYVAPEVVMGREYDEKVDVWSAGVVLYVMLAGIPPFYGDSVEEIFESVIRGNLRFPPKIFRNVSPAAKDLLRKMICRDPSRRISAEQALFKFTGHPWILAGGETNPMD